MNIPVTITENAKCPECEAPNDAATEVHGSDASPQEGDICICFTCGLLAIYTVNDNELTVRRATNEELEELQKIPTMAAAFAISERIRAER